MLSDGGATAPDGVARTDIARTTRNGSRMAPVFHARMRRGSAHPAPQQVHAGAPAPACAAGNPDQTEGPRLNPPVAAPPTTGNLLRDEPARQPRRDTHRRLTVRAAASAPAVQPPTAQEVADAVQRGIRRHADAHGLQLLQDEHAVRLAAETDLDGLVGHVAGLAQAAAAELEPGERIRFARIRHEQVIELLAGSFADVGFHDELSSAHIAAITERLGPTIITHHPTTQAPAGARADALDPRAACTARLPLPGAGTAATAVELAGGRARADVDLAALGRWLLGTRHPGQLAC